MIGRRVILVIDIIIPVYDSRDTLASTLDSILEQENTPDLNVYIVDDASSYGYDDIIESYADRVDIHYMLLTENHGPGYARQYGMEHSHGEYIIFLDSDDTFYDKNSVCRLYQSITSNDYDVVRSVIYALNDNGYVIYKNDNIGLHGKIYKRSFIMNHRICFNDTRSNEDTGFNALIMLCGARYCDIDDVTYLWCDNKKSITRRDKDRYKDIDLENYAYNMYWAYLQARNRGIINDKYILETVIEMYDRYLQTFDDKTKFKIGKYALSLVLLMKKEDINKKIDEYGIKDVYDSQFVDEAFCWVFKMMDGDSADSEDSYQAVYDEDAVFDRMRHIDLMNQFNMSNPYDREHYIDYVSSMFGSIGATSLVIPPFYANWGGKNVYIGEGCYINFGVSMVDDGDICIGNDVLIGPNVNILTVNHPVDSKKRLERYISVNKVVIKDNVWIGAGAIILPGVTIGENSVIGAGSVVTKDIPANVVAVGNPCKVIKNI